MISTPLALKLSGVLYIFILITNAASVGLGNRTGETDTAAMLATISQNPGRYRMGVIGAIAYGILLVQSGAVPSMIAWLGLAAGTISAIGILIKLASSFGALAVTGMVLMMVFEIAFGGWLLLFSHAYVGKLWV